MVLFLFRAVFNVIEFENSESEKMNLSDRNKENDLIFENKSLACIISYCQKIFSE
jgi:hypothetical protein